MMTTPDMTPPAPPRPAEVPLVQPIPEPIMVPIAPEFLPELMDWSEPLHLRVEQTAHGYLLVCKKPAPHAGLLTDEQRELLNDALNPPSGVESWPKSASTGHAIRKDCIALGVSYFDAVSRVLHDLGLTNATTKTNAERAAWLLMADARLRGDRAARAGGANGE